MSELTVINPPQAATPAVESGLRLLPKSGAWALAEHPDRGAVLRECREVIAAEPAASIETFALILERFALHFPENRLSPEEQRLVLGDWRRLMGDLPADILQSACDAYIMSPARWFPTPGQLYAVGKQNWEYRKALVNRARDTLRIMGEA